MSTERTQNTISPTAQAISSARKARLESTRAFAAELNVSANLVSMWERGLREPGSDKLADWYTDERQWVHQMAVDIFVARYREALVGRGITVPLAA